MPRREAEKTRMVGCELVPFEQSIDKMRSELHDAVTESNLCEVQKLLSNDTCPIDNAVIEKAALTCYNKPVFQAIATSLAERRRYLMKVARQYGMFKSVPEDEQLLLDVQASHIASVLLESAEVDKHVIISSVWDFSHDSVYTLVGCNLAAAQILYDAGFKSIDELNEYELSPLAWLKLPEKGCIGDSRLYDDMDVVLGYLYMCGWFHDYGASLTRQTGSSAQTPLHHIARQTGKGFAAAIRSYLPPTPLKLRPANVRPERPPPIFKPFAIMPLLLKDILLDTTHRDQYSCPCSTGGRLPMNVLLNELVCNCLTPTEIAPLVARFLGFDADMFSESALTTQIRLNVFRACVFESLCVEHSCDLAKKKDNQYLRDGQVENVDLDFLVFLFDVSLARSGTTLPAYIMTKWADEMEHFLVEYLRGTHFLPDLGGRLPYNFENGVLPDGGRIPNHQGKTSKDLPGSTTPEGGSTLSDLKGNTSRDIRGNTAPGSESSSSPDLKGCSLPGLEHYSSPDFEDYSSPDPGDCHSSGSECCHPRGFGSFRYTFSDTGPRGYTYADALRA